MVAKGFGVTGPVDSSDEGAADASADTRENGTDPSGEQCHGAKRHDLFMWMCR